MSNKLECCQNNFGFVLIKDSREWKITNLQKFFLLIFEDLAKQDKLVEVF